MIKTRANDERYLIQDLDYRDSTVSVTYYLPFLWTDVCGKWNFTPPLRGGIINSRLHSGKETKGHSHPWSGEYLFIYGNGKIKIGNKEIICDHGKKFTIPPNEFHKVVNLNGNDLIFVTGGRHE